MRKKRTEPVSISSGFVLHENEYVLLSFHGDTKRAVSILNTDELIQSLEEIKKRKEMELPRLLRPYFEEIDMKNRAVLVFGSRGVGKTTFLLNRFRDRRMLYLSADNPLVATTDLWSIASTAFVRGYEGIIVDEAHYARDWSVHLKAIYDAYPTKLIIASDSSSLILRQGIADLSRRFSRVRIPLMSLREYIYLRDGALLPLLSPFALDSSVVKEIMAVQTFWLLSRSILTAGSGRHIWSGTTKSRLNTLSKKRFTAMSRSLCLKSRIFTLD
jgi:predicted AAA+ superfamily ATPase